MKNQIKLLPALAMALGATLALAFTDAGSANDPKFATLNNGQTWYNLTGAQEGIEYLCNEAVDVTCKFTQRSTDPMHAIASPRGQFVPITVEEED